MSVRLLFIVASKPEVELLLLPTGTVFSTHSLLSVSLSAAVTFPLHAKQACVSAAQLYTPYVHNECCEWKWTGFS